MSKLKAATDGSADKPGPGAGGWAWVTSEGTWAWGNRPRTDNIRMELTAVLKLLQSHPDRPLLIHAEAPVFNTFTDWIHQWRENGMRRANGREPKNIDLITQIDALLVGRKDIKWKLVRARGGDRLNESADRLAGFARSQARLGHRR